MGFVGRNVGLGALSVVLSGLAWWGTTALAEGSDCQIDPVIPTAGDVEFGRALALAGDTLVVTSGGSDGQGTIAFYEWGDDGGGGHWEQIQQISAIEPDQRLAGGFGTTVATGADGATIAVGATGGGQPGVVYLFGDDGGSTWRQDGVLTAADLKTTDGGASFGTSVAVSDDGLRAMIGAPGDAKGQGTVYRFADTGGFGDWKEYSPVSAAEMVSSGAGFGSQVGAGGGTAAIASPGAKEGLGTVSIFRDDGGKWAPTVTLAAGPDDKGFGTRLATDGTVLAITAPGGQGGLYLYDVLGPGEVALSKRFAAADLTGDTSSTPDQVAVSGGEVVLATKDLEGGSLVLLRRDETLAWTSFATRLAEPVTSMAFRGGSLATATPAHGVEVIADLEACIAPPDDGDGVPTGDDACPEIAGGELDLDGDGCPDERDAVADALSTTLAEAWGEAIAAADATGQSSDRAQLASGRLALVGPPEKPSALGRFREGRFDLTGVRFAQAWRQLDKVRSVDTWSVEQATAEAEYLATLSVIRDHAAEYGEGDPGVIDAEACLAQYADDGGGWKRDGSLCVLSGLLK